MEKQINDYRVDAVKAHAAEHYEDGGWDVIVECYTDEMVLELVRGSRSVKGGSTKAPSAKPRSAGRRIDRAQEQTQRQNGCSACPLKRHWLPSHIRGAL